METVLKVMLPFILPSLTKTVKNLLVVGLTGSFSKLEELAKKTSTQVDDELVGLFSNLASGGEDALAVLAPVFQPLLDTLWTAAKETSNPWDNAGVSLLAGILNLELKG